MADMRHRDGKLKTMHTIIGDFGKVLRQIAVLDEVESILTGTIAPSKSYKESLTFQYFTDNGLKLLAKTTTAVQEIFIVTTAPDLLLDEIQKMGYLDREREDVRHNAPHRRKHGNRSDRDLAHKENPHSEATANESATAEKTNDGAARLRAESSDPLTLRQRLNPQALSALMKLKEDVAPKRREETAPKATSTTPTKPVKRADKRKPYEEEENFAALFAPEDDEESFAELFNKSKLDPKFFK